MGRSLYLAVTGTCFAAPQLGAEPVNDRSLALDIPRHTGVER